MRRLTDELRRGEPKYDLLNEGMANALRGRLSSLHDLFMTLGAIETVTFMEINAFYGDIYNMKLANGSVYWAIALDNNGKVVMWEVRPVSEPAQK